MFKGNFIDGRFVRPSQNIRSFVSEDPGDLDSPVGEVRYSVDAVDAAARAAREAFPAWAALKPNRRDRYFLSFEKLLKKHKEALARLVTREMGKPLHESEVEIDRILAKFESARKDELDLVRPASHKLPGFVGRLVWRPRGVMAVLSPFNVPAYLALAPTVSAMANGNTVILKPSELVPFVGQKIAQLWEESGLPRGVFNLVQGAGDVGAALVGHPLVDGVLFTGSWRTGSQIETALLKEPRKLCALEMGGKNAAIVLNDADLELAAAECAAGAFMTTGQRCNATSRILLEKKIADKFTSLFLKKIDAIKIGYGLEKEVSMGPVVSRRAFGHVLSSYEKAKEEGFETLREGGELSYSKKGYYLKPSVHFKKKAPLLKPTEGAYAFDEVFGPDTAIYRVENFEEAIRANNRSLYGLVTSVFTRSRKNFEKTLSQARSGLVNWNVATTRSSPHLPFGGLERSGNHRPAGFFLPYLCTVPTASIERSP